MGAPAGLPQPLAECVVKTVHGVQTEGEAGGRARRRGAGGVPDPPQMARVERQTLATAASMGAAVCVCVCVKTECVEREKRGSRGTKNETGE